MNPGKAPARARFHHGVSDHQPEAMRRVGYFPDGDRLRLQEYARYDGSIVSDPLAWIAAERPADLGRWR